MNRSRRDIKIENINRNTTEYLKELNDFNIVKRILQLIIFINYCRYFYNKPSDVLSQMLPYNRLIKNPIWLLEVERKLNAGEYNDLAHFIEDMRLLFENCYRFWGPKHLITKIGLYLEHHFELRLQALPKIWSGLRKSYYEVLGVSPTATQAEIKAAYYKLSLLHHPDRNEGSAEKFQAITSAYETLGNFNSRKMYDRGMETIYDGATSTARSDFSDRKRHRAPAPSGRTPVYDFDEWSRIHYGKAFERRAEAKARYEHNKSQNDINEWKIENVIYGTFGLLIIFGIINSLFNNNDLDQPRKKKEN